MLSFKDCSKSKHVHFFVLILIWYAAGRGGVDRLLQYNMVNAVYFMIAIRDYSMEEILQKYYHSPLKQIKSNYFLQQIIKHF